MYNTKLMQEKISFLIKERESIESTGSRFIDHDLEKIYRFINREIQNLQLLMFKNEYRCFSNKLEEIFNAGPSFPSKEKGNGV